MKSEGDHGLYCALAAFDVAPRVRPNLCLTSIFSPMLQRRAVANEDLNAPYKRVSSGYRTG